MIGFCGMLADLSAAGADLPEACVLTGIGLARRGVFFVGRPVTKWPMRCARSAVVEVPRGPAACFPAVHRELWWPGARITGRIWARPCKSPVQMFGTAGAAYGSW